ncbi:MAG: hypothetical protein ABI395_10070 [Sphingobium sp.]
MKQLRSDSPPVEVPVRLPAKKLDSLIASISRVTGYVVFVVTFAALVAVAFL